MRLPINVITPIVLAGAALLAGLLPVRALAEARMNVPLHVSDVPTPGNVSTVVAAGARCMAVSEAQSLLAAGCNGERTAWLLLYRLDDKGNLREGEPARTEVPLPDLFKESSKNRVQAVAFHPTRPLLYVWRDVEVRRDKHPPVDTFYNNLDHLLIYSVADGKPALVQGVAHGNRYEFGVHEGGMSVDPAGRRIYVPNAQRPADPPKPMLFSAMVGYIPLDDAGMPVMDAGAARLVARDSPERYQQHWLDPKTDLPYGHDGPYPFSGNLVAYTEKHDVYVMDIDAPPSAAGQGQQTGRPSVSRMPLLEIARMGYATCGPHPDLPVVFVAGNGRVVRVEYADTQPTLMPQWVSFDEGPYTGPVVMAPERRDAAAAGRPGKVAIAIRAWVYLIGIDKDARFTGEAERFEVPYRSWYGLCYSAKLDRFYVAVEQLPPPPKEPGK